MHAKGRWVDISKYVRKKVPFYMHIVVLICKPFLSYFVVFGGFFHYCLKKTFAMIIFLSQIFYCLFLYGFIASIFKNIPVRGGGEGSAGYEYVLNEGGRSKRTSKYDGEGGSNFLPFWSVGIN